MLKYDRTLVKAMVEDILSGEAGTAYSGMYYYVDMSDLLHTYGVSLSSTTYVLYADAVAKWLLRYKRVKSTERVGTILKIHAEGELLKV